MLFASFAQVCLTTGDQNKNFVVFTFKTKTALPNPVSSNHIKPFA